MIVEKEERISLPKPKPTKEIKFHSCGKILSLKGREETQDRDKVQTHPVDKLPIECDIYSLPLDNIPAVQEKDLSPERCRRESDRLKKSQRHSIHIGESRESLESRTRALTAGESYTTTTTTRGVKARNSQRHHHLLRNSLELRDSKNEEETERRLVQAEMIRTRLELERNNNNNEEELPKSLQPGSTRKASNQRYKKRRSDCSVDKIENTLPGGDGDAHGQDQNQKPSQCKNLYVYSISPVTLLHFELIYFILDLESKKIYIFQAPQIQMKIPVAVLERKNVPLGSPSSTYSGEIDPRRRKFCRVQIKMRLSKFMLHVFMSFRM